MVLHSKIKCTYKIRIIKKKELENMRIHKIIESGAEFKF